MNFYRINQENLEVKKSRIDFALTKINQLLPKIKKVSMKIILFGSASRGEQTFNSDIDLFILASNKDLVRFELKKIDPKLKVNAIIKTPNEWSEMEIKDSQFFSEIKNGITLYNYVPRI